MKIMDFEDFRERRAEGCRELNEAIKTIEQDFGPDGRVSKVVYKSVDMQKKVEDIIYAHYPYSNVSVTYEDKWDAYRIKVDWFYKGQRRAIDWRIYPEIVRDDERAADALIEAGCKELMVNMFRDNIGR